MSIPELTCLYIFLEDIAKHILFFAIVMELTTQARWLRHLI
jgi:hypothetical protein